LLLLTLLGRGEDSVFRSDGIHPGDQSRAHLLPPLWALEDVLQEEFRAWQGQTLISLRLPQCHLL
jgi:hypothetical protein